MADPTQKLIELAGKLSINAPDFVYIKKAMLTLMIHTDDEDAAKNTSAFNALIGNINNIKALSPNEKVLVYDFLQRVFCEWLVPDDNGNVNTSKNNMNVAEVLLRTPAWKVKLTHGEGDSDTISDVGLAFALINATRSSGNDINTFISMLSSDVVMSLMLFFRIMLVFIYKSTTRSAHEAANKYFFMTAGQLGTVVMMMRRNTISFSPFVSAMISFLGRYMGIVTRVPTMPKAQIAFILDSMDDIMLGNYEDCFDIRGAITDNVYIFTNSFSKIGLDT